MRQKLQGYFLVAKHTWDEYLVYRLNFAMWRLRNILQLLTTYFLWFIVMPSNGSLLGYTKSSMLTYVLLSEFFSSIVLSSLVGEVANEITSGDLSNYLIKPINYFIYWFFRDLGDKAMNISFATGELIILLIILHPPFFVQTNPGLLVLTIFSLICAVVSYFFINFLLGTIGFWSAEVWAPKFIFFTLLTFFSGGIFPLDILPKPLYTLLQFLPFTYLLYFPLKIYLGQLSLQTILYGLFISTAWVGLLYVFTMRIWNKGMRIYSAQGR